MATRKYRVDVTRTMVLEVDEAVFDTVDDEWRRTFYNLDGNGIVEHIGFNIARGASLSQLDGFALSATAARG